MPRAQRRKTRRSTRTIPPTPSISGAGETHVGNSRGENQDVIVVEPDLGLYAVFDGLGGGDAGDVAARVAADSIIASVRGRIFVPQLSPRQLIMRALRVASLDVRLASEAARSSLGMGTTAVVCLIVSPTLAVIGHIGDSRAYLLRDGKLKALTRDHTPVQELIDMGDLTVRGAKRHPKRHALFRYLGVPRGDFPDVMEQPLKPGDRLLLCSDGLHGYTPESAIRRVLATRGGPELIAQRIMGLALRGEAPDNVSAVVVSAGDRAANPGSGRRRPASRRGVRPPR